MEDKNKQFCNRSFVCTDISEAKEITRRLNCLMRLEDLEFYLLLNHHF